MKRVAVFGKPGSGKSTLSQALAAITGLPLHQLDGLYYDKKGNRVESEAFEAAHDAILSSDAWLVDGFGTLASFNKRLDAADTLIYIDLPYKTSYWLVTKRLFTGFFTRPNGWPEGSSTFKGSWQSYQTLRLCPRFWNSAFSQRLQAMSAHKSVFIIQSLSELNQFVAGQFTSKLNS